MFMVRILDGSVSIVIKLRTGNPRLYSRQRQGRDFSLSRRACTGSEAHSASNLIDTVVVSP